MPSGDAISGTVEVGYQGDSPEGPKGTYGDEGSPHNGPIYPKRVDGKRCGVCGDKALGYNFNAITCESCKAFFRRNALKNKDFRCPFNDSCEVTCVTRRFCQKCRLRKCFEVGMRKEWIMTDEEKLKKKRKIEENRARKKGEISLEESSSDSPPSLMELQSDSSTSDGGGTWGGTPGSVPTLVPLGCSSSSKETSKPQAVVVGRVRQQEESPAKVRKTNCHSNVHSPKFQDDFIVLLPKRTPNHLELEDLEPKDSSDSLPQNSSGPGSELSQYGLRKEDNVSSSQEVVINSQESSSPPSDGHTKAGVLPLILQSKPQERYSSKDGKVSSPETSPRSLNESGFAASGSSVTPSRPSNENLSHSTEVLHPLHSPLYTSISTAMHEIIVKREIERDDDDTPIKTEQFHTPFDSYGDSDSHGFQSPPLKNLNGQIPSSPSTPTSQSFEFNIQESLKLLNPGCRSIRPAESHSVAHNMDTIMNTAISAEYSAFSFFGSSNSHKLNQAEEMKLSELYEANRGLMAPLCEDSNFKDSPNPSLINVVNLTEIAIRRLIKMAKRISSFKSFCQEDQIALLKAGCTELNVLRSVYAYDPDKESWMIPQDHDSFKNIKLKILKAAPGNIYEEFKRFLKGFQSDWRTDYNIMLILSAIALFTPERPCIIHPEAIRHEQSTYLYLLKRYLECKYGGCEGRTHYYQLLDRISQLHVLNEHHVKVFLEMNPKEMEPLLIEMFDLKQS